jgi:hypothetical protein
LQDSPFHAFGSFGWNIYNNEMAFNRGVGVSTQSGYTLGGNYIHNNQTSGYLLCGSGVALTDNEVSFNNPQGMEDPANSAAGGKTYETTGAVISYNYVHDNVGPGIWEDVDSVGTTIMHNDVENNAKAGVQHEISWNAVIQHNYFRGNGTSTKYCGPGTTGNFYCSAIFISNGGGQTGTIVDISYNTIAAGGEYAGGVSLLNTNRGTSSLYPSYGPWLVRNVHVHDNTVNLSASGSDFGAVDHDGSDSAMFTSQGNSFDYDTFTGAGSRSVFYWGEGNIYGIFHTFAGFQDKGQEAHGSSN